MDRKAERYFRRVYDYNVGDIKTLLDTELKCAGPLLTATVNGIDTFGGMCYGFGCGSKKRAKLFMPKKMCLSESLSDFIYRSVRCGMAHQGMPQIGLRFFVLYGRPDTGNLLYRDGYNSNPEYIYMNVAEFAYCYLDAVEMIAKAPENHIKHYPRSETSDKCMFIEALEDVHICISSICDGLAELRWSPQTNTYKRRSVMWPPGMSASAYGPENTIDFMEIPADEDTAIESGEADSVDWY